MKLLHLRLSLKWEGVASQICFSSVMTCLPLRTCLFSRTATLLGDWVFGLTSSKLLFSSIL